MKLFYFEGSFSIWMSLLSEVTALHTKHCVSAALGTGNMTLSQQPLAPWNCPPSYSISPWLLNPSSAHTGFWTKKSHAKGFLDCQLTWEHTLFLYPQYSVALCCYTNAILSKHGFNTTICLAWKFSVRCASKPVRN